MLRATGTGDGETSPLDISPSKECTFLNSKSGIHIKCLRAARAWGAAGVAAQAVVTVKHSQPYTCATSPAVAPRPAPLSLHMYIKKY